MAGKNDEGAKRKRDEEENAEEDEEEADEKPLKKAATEAPLLKKDKDGGFFAALGQPKEFKNSKTEKRVTVSSFKGNVNVQFREYYEKDGKMLPGKSGLSLNKEQFSTVLVLADQIKSAIKELE